MARRHHRVEPPVDDARIRAAAASLRRSYRLNMRVCRPDVDDDATADSAMALSMRTIERLISVRAGSLETLMLQASALRWMYEPALGGDVTTLSLPAASLEERLHQALIRGLYDLSRISAEGPTDVD